MMLISMNDIVIVVVVFVVTVVLVVGSDASFHGEVMQAQVIVVVEPRIVVHGKTVTEIQSRHRHGDARIRRPHALKRHRVV